MMKSVVLPQYNRNVLRALLSLKVEELPIPKCNDDEVLVKTHASPVNPSDIAFIQGSYNVVKTLPAVPGFEGSGTVVEASGKYQHLKGKPVSFFIQDDSHGTWSEYVKVNVRNLLVLRDDMDMNQAACFAINPFTAYGLFQIALQRSCKALIVNAAGGQVPALMRALANEEGLEVINIVRKAETLERLKQQGCAHVLDETEDAYPEKLTQLAHELQATVAFDAVGGPASGILFNAMPPDSELVVYGGLSNKPMADLSVMDLIFKDKLISGFNLSPWMEEMETDDFERISELLQEKFIKGIWHTEIQSIVPLEDVVNGLKAYLGNMSGGKILLKP